MFKKAVLIIHGFGGGTYDEESIAYYLQYQKYYDVFSFTLPGHDSRATKVTREDWLNSSKEHVELLIKHGYREIYLIGHSMGGVIASVLASKYKEVKKLVLAAPAFEYLNINESDKINIKETIELAKINLKEYHTEEVISRFLRMPTNSLNEFIKLVKENYNVTNKLDIPILIIHGSNDSLVPISSCEHVYNTVKSNYKELLLVNGVNHDIFRNNKVDIINKEVLSFLRLSNKRVNKKFTKNI